MMRTLPATRLRRPARVHELPIAAGIDSSATFVRQDGGAAPPSRKKGAPVPHRVRPSASIASGKNAWQLARSIASLATGLQSVVASQPAADYGRRQR